ncbi:MULTISPECIES: hypothetical protein [Enterococcus]|uniref:PqqD family protein n=1 Tax=Enterococcus mundtii TaxID=53346 RepID=A0A1I4P8R3_ENTMU|nr:MULTISPECIES: hypothetical protein [Enterococcus]GEN19315.1 hypothetical protein LAC02_25960 [Ligilactobacillus acidipiscis]AUB54046.1 hypothetical protein EM4838_14160 [Enterococcus mundtii]MZZ59570.1 hypothetical protein [Enterococcus mundtii]MZZ62641.1 hypothetical protein [Enterococcus mundtii]MZZ69648.1 hypothetical protein [Enterococcus mundtii]
MKLNENITYEKMGNDLYIMVESERFVLDNDVAIDIFDLLKAESTKENIKAFVRNKYRLDKEFTDEEKDAYVEEFLTVLKINGIMTGS